MKIAQVPQVNESELAGLLDAVPLPMVQIDSDGRIALANASGTSLLGSSQIGRDHVIGLRQPALLEVINRAFHEGIAGQAHYEVIGASDASNMAAYLVTVTPVLIAGERQVICAFQDVSAHEHVNQLRQDFIANVSHELRSPLTSLLGIIETLKSTARDDPAARSRFLDIMQQEVERMARLVRDLLSLSQTEARERQKPTTQVDVIQLTGTVIDTLRPVADAAGVALEMTAADGAIAPIPADADQLVQIMQNLISNAIAYDRLGKSVTVAIHPAGDMLRIDVRDHGEGIAPEHLPRLTERFYRVESHRARIQGGAGLGLAIVKHIVNRHRGRLSISSQRGKGTCVSVFLPKA